MKIEMIDDYCIRSVDTVQEVNDGYLAICDDSSMWILVKDVKVFWQKLPSIPGTVDAGERNT